MRLNISSGVKKRAQRVVIYGTEGIGKTTLASQFPDPLYIDLEDGSSTLDVKRITLNHPVDYEDLLNTVEEVSKNPDVCQTLIIDTADRAEEICTKYICDKYSKGSIEAFGYGKGYTVLAENFKKLLDNLDDCIRAGINTVVISHAQLRKIEQPEQEGAYDHWELKLSKKVAPVLKEWSDMLLFCNYKTLVVEEGQNKTKKAKGGKHVMYATHTPFWDAKNRAGLPSQMDMSFDAIKGAFSTKVEKSAETPSTADNVDVKSTVDTKRAAVEEENKKARSEYMDKVNDVVNSIPDDGKEEVPWDAAADEVSKIPAPEEKPLPRRTRRTR